MRGKETGDKKIHPHQKPVILYKKLLIDYAKPGYKILDTHLGSGSSAIACIDMGYDLTGCELDKDYYEGAMERIQEHIQQAELFEAGDMRSEVKEKCYLWKGIK
jgi:site-specific DNA-methyltransferase (adenine-specific)